MCVYSWKSGTYRRNSNAWWFEIRPWTSHRIPMELQSTNPNQDLTIVEQLFNSHKVYMQSKPIKPGYFFVHRFFCGLVIAGCEAFLQWLRSVSARIMDANCEAELRATFLKGPRKIPWANTQESRHKSLITFDGCCLWDLYLCQRIAAMWAYHGPPPTSIVTLWCQGFWYFPSGKSFGHSASWHWDKLHLCVRTDIFG